MTSSKRKSASSSWPNQKSTATGIYKKPETTSKPNKKMPIKKLPLPWVIPAEAAVKI